MFNPARSLKVAQESLDSCNTIYETSVNSITTRQEKLHSKMYDSMKLLCVHIILGLNFQT